MGYKKNELQRHPNDQSTPLLTALKDFEDTEPQDRALKV